METSKLLPDWQRTRDWCKPGQADQLNILPEPETERAITVQVHRESPNKRPRLVHCYPDASISLYTSTGRT